MSSRVVVSDSSVLIDLERGSLFAAAFALHFEFCVPDLLYRRELEAHGGDRLLALGLKILDLDGPGVERAARYRRIVPALSLSDAFALALAHRTGGTLLTGDGPLRRLTHDEEVACHGVLWLLDRMNARHTATPRQLHNALTTIREHPRCRLPETEVIKRLRAFKRADQGP